MGDLGERMEGVGAYGSPILKSRYVSVAVGALLLMLSGCGAVYSVQRHVVGGSGEGTYGLEYSLPENLIEVTIPIRETGRSEGKLESCAVKCGFTEGQAPGPSVTFGVPTFRSIVDPIDADRFVVDLSAPRWPLKSRSLQMTLSRFTPVTFASTSEDVSMEMLIQAGLRAGSMLGLGVEVTRSPDAGRRKSGMRSRGLSDECSKCVKCVGEAAVLDELKKVEDGLNAMMFSVASSPRGIDVGTYDRLKEELIERRRQASR